MFVILNETLATADTCFQQGEIYEVPDQTGAIWEASGLAKRTDYKPAHIKAMYDVLEQGKDQPVIFLPDAGTEFGHRILTGIRICHFHQSKDKLVCCRKGEEVLYPDCQHFTSWTDPVPDQRRIGTYRDTPIQWKEIEKQFPNRLPIRTDGLTPEQELVYLCPGERIPFQPKRRGTKADVVIGTRSRLFDARKNWKHWDALGRALGQQGITYAVVGDRAGACDVEGQTCHSRDTDEAIELIQGCRLYVGTDSGTSHLMASVGANAFIIDTGFTNNRNLISHIEDRNSGRTWTLGGMWQKPESVIKAVIKEMQRPL